MICGERLDRARRGRKLLYLRSGSLPKTCHILTKSHRGSLTATDDGYCIVLKCVEYGLIALWFGG